VSTLTSDQLNQLLQFAGFKKNSQTITDMVGICYAESGGNPNAHNGNASTGDDSYGLWQINMIGDLGPTRRKKFGISSNDKLFDPETNAKAAYVIYKEQGLDAWTTYKNGDYLKHMDKMTTAEGGNKNPVAAVTDQFSGLTGAIDSIGKNIFKAEINISGIIVAIVLLILGVAILISQTKQGKAIVDAGVGKVGAVL
jgi:hypothetical protein